MVIVGTINGWTMISLHYLISGTGGVPLTLTFDESSWIVSLTVLGSMIGSLLGVQLVARSGCRKCLVLCNAMFTLGWFIIYTTASLPILYLARVILGIGFGIANTANPIYMSAIAEINISGILDLVIATGASVGTIFSYILGIWMTYKLLLMILVVISFITFVLNMCISATQYFSQATDETMRSWKTMEYYRDIQNPRTQEMELRAQTRYELPSQSRSNLSSQYRSDSPRQTTSELHQPSTSELRQPSTIEIHPEPTSEIHPRTRRELHHLHILTKFTWTTKLREILQRSNRKALFIMLGLIMAQQLSGNFITMQYLQVLFDTITIDIDVQEATIFVLGVNLISGCIFHLQVPSLGRRILLILSTLGSCFTLIILATYLLLVEHEFDVSTVATLPVYDLMIYQIVFHIGLGTLPNVLLYELFPTELIGFVGTIIVIFDGIIGFTVSKLYQVIIDNVGPCAIYFIFATSCFLAFLMVLIWIPETKGKTYQQIEALLVGENLNSLNEEVRTDEMDVHRF